MSGILRLSVVAALAVGIAGFLPRAAFAHAEDWDDRFVEALRERRLWEYADRVCRERFDRAKEAREAAHWTVEGMRTDAARALEAPAERQTALWKEVEAWADRFQKRFPDSPWALQVALQSVLAKLAQGEAKRLESELTRGDDRVRLQREALAILRKTERRLRELTRRMERGEFQGGDQDTSMPPEIMQNIENQLVLAGARVYWNRALCYAPGTDDRLAALEAARSDFQRLIRQTRPQDRIQVEALLGLARCQRVLGDFDEAEKTLRSLERLPDVPARWKLEADAERLLLAHEQHRSRLPVEPRVGRTINGVHSPIWDLAALQVLLDRLALAKGDQAAKLQEEIDRAIATIEVVHGPYWGRRATQLMVEQTSGVANIAGARLLERSAREKLGGGAWQEAVTLLRQASEAASRSGRNEEAFRLAYQAALVQQQHGAWEEAAEELRSLALRWRRDTRAAQAHLLAIWSLGKARGDELARDPTYLSWLDEQIHVWPDAEATHRARLWMAKWLRAKAKYREALRVLGAVAPSSSAAADADRELFLVWLSLCQKAGDSPASKDLLKELESFYREHFTAANDDEATVCSFRITYYQMRMLLEGKPRDQIMEKLRKWAEPTSNRAACSARSRFVLAVWGEREVSRLEEADWKELPPMQWHWLGILWQQRLRKSEESRRIGTSVAMLFERGLKEWKGQIDPRERLYWLQVRADALAVSGERAAARRLLEDLVKKHPSDIGVRQSWARFLAHGEGETEWREAEAAWRYLALRLKPGSAPWYEAKYGVARALFLQGKKEDCRQRLQYLKATRGFGPPPWEQRLRDLARQCGVQ